MNPDNESLIRDIIGDRMLKSFKNALEGHSSNVVDPQRYEDSKSISTSQTYDYNLFDYDDILIELKNMSKRLHQDLKEQEYLTKTISITLRDSDFKTITRSKSIDYTDSLYEINDVIEDLLYDNFIEKEYRLIGVGYSNLIKSSDLALEYNLFTWKSILEKEDNINDIIKEFKNKYGDAFIRKGVELNDKKE